MSGLMGRQGVGWPPLLWCVAAFIVSILLVARPGLCLPCRRSGLCSTGKLQPYFGEIQSTQTLANLRQLGFEHVLMLSTDAIECKHVADSLPRVGCSWSSFKLPVKVPYAFLRMAPLWHIRWRTLARLIRMSYNVMLADTDITLYDDPYRYMKSPPFNKFTILNQPEVLYDQQEYDDNKLPNGGIVYVQNANPSGPAAWLIAEVSHRLLRWIDDDYRLLQSRGMNTHCCYMDQDCFADSLSSVQAGRPLWQWSWDTCSSQSYRESHKSEFEAMQTALSHLVQDVWNLSEHVLPAWMHRIARGNTTKIRWFTMRQPTAQGSWPKRLGGNLYPPPGNLTTQFMNELKDVTSASLWPDPEDTSPTAVQTALDTPPERFMFFPPFLVSGYNPRGRLGYWNPVLTGWAAEQVIAHAHYLPGSDSAVGKHVVKMMHGTYDYTLAHQMLGQRVYFKDQGLPQSSHTPSPPTQGLTGDSQFIALHPRIHLDRTRSWQQLQQILIGLAQVGSLLGRTVLWPDLPCNTSWISNGMSGPGQLPLSLRYDWLPWSPAATSGGAAATGGGAAAQGGGAAATSAGAAATGDSALNCAWSHALKEGCLFAGRGMLSVEWRYYTQRYGLQQSLRPARWNSFLVPSRAHFHVNSSSASPVDSIMILPEDQVVAAGKNYSLDPVVFLAVPVQVQYMSRDPPSSGLVAYKQAYSECPILSETSINNLIEGDITDAHAATHVTYLQASVASGRVVSAGKPAAAHKPIDLKAAAETGLDGGGGGGMAGEGDAGFDLEKEEEMLLEAEAKQARLQAWKTVRARSKAARLKHTPKQSTAIT